MAMNIDEMRNAVLLGNIATIESQIKTWEIYSERTGETVTTIIAALRAHQAALTAMITT